MGFTCRATAGRAVFFVLVQEGGGYVSDAEGVFFASLSTLQASV